MSSPLATFEFLQSCSARLQLQAQLLEPAVVLVLQAHAAKGELPELLASAAQFFGLGSASRLAGYIQRHSSAGSVGAAWQSAAVGSQAAEEAAAVPSEAALAVILEAVGRARQGEPGG